MGSQKRFIGCLAVNRWFLHLVFQSNDMVFVGCDCKIFTEYDFVEHIVLEIVCRPVKVHNLEDRISRKDEDVHFLCNKDLSDVNKWMLEGFLSYFRPFF